MKWSEALTQIWQSTWAMTFLCSHISLVIVLVSNEPTRLGWQRGASRNTCNKGWVRWLTYSYHDWKILVRNVIHEILLSICSVHLEECAAGNYLLKGWVFTELYKTFKVRLWFSETGHRYIKVHVDSWPKLCVHTTTTSLILVLHSFHELYEAVHTNFFISTTVKTCTHAQAWFPLPSVCVSIHVPLSLDPDLISFA